MTTQDATIQAVLQANRAFVKALQEAILALKSQTPTLESQKLQQGLQFQLEQVVGLRVGMEHSLQDMQIAPPSFLVIAGATPKHVMQ